MPRGLLLLPVNYRSHDCIRHDWCTRNHAELPFTLANLNWHQPAFSSRSLLIGNKRLLDLKWFGPTLSASGSVAEWSKALVLGTSLFEGVGSNPTAAKFHFCITRKLVAYSLIEIQRLRYLRAQVPPPDFQPKEACWRFDSVLQHPLRWFVVVVVVDVVVVVVLWFLYK